MKKITLLLCFLFCGLYAVAQDNWNLINNDGFNVYSSRFYDMVYFNSVYYVAGDSEQVEPRVFRSFPGTAGSWSEYSNITPYFQGGSEDAISRLAVDITGNYLFMGSANYSGGFQTPQIYRATSSSWEAYDTIPYSQNPYNYQDISDMEFFSATAGYDTVFAFVSSFTGLEVWKTKVSAASPTWVQTLVMPSSTSIVNEVVRHNNQLFVATCGDANGGFLLHTSDGLIWDTLGYGGLGFGSNHYAIKSLCVFNGDLYAGTQNNVSGAGIFKSSDNGQTWTQVDLTSMGFSFPLTSVADLKVKINWLFAAFITTDSPSDYVTVGHALPGQPFVPSTNATYLDNEMLFTYFGGGARLWPFPNNRQMFVTANSNDNQGAMLRLDLPYAYVGYVTTGLCQGDSFRVNMNSSSYVTSYQWFQNGVPVSTSAVDTFACPALGNYDFVIRAYNGGIYDSIHIPVEVVPQQTGTVTANPGFTICPGQPVTLDFNQATGNPYYAIWRTVTGSPLDSTQGFGASFIPAPVTATTYSLHLYDPYNCAYDTTFTVNTNTATDITGLISYSGGAVNNGNVYVLKYQPTYSGTDTVATLPLSAGGSYTLSGALYGQYLVKADPDISIAAYSNTISTYNGGFFRWDSASPFLHTCAANSQIDITVLELPLQNGTATISGHVVEGPGYGQRLMNPQHNPFVVPGGPLKGIDVKLGKNPAGGIQARTMTDTSATSTGYYEFTNVPPGDYRIYVDIPNLPMDSLREVTVLVGTDSIPDNDYKADSVMVYVEPTVGIKNNSNAISNNIRVFPNPATEWITLEYELQQTSEVNISIYDLVGKTIAANVITAKEQKGKHQQTVRVEELPAGVYFVQLKIDNTVHSFKLTVSK